MCRVQPQRAVRFEGSILSGASQAVVAWFGVVEYPPFSYVGCPGVRCGSLAALARPYSFASYWPDTLPGGRWLCLDSSSPLVPVAAGPLLFERFRVTQVEQVCVALGFA